MRALTIRRDRGLRWQTAVRSGTVRAERLTRTRRWQTSTGAPLRGKRGDWWVWEDDPQQGRSVAAAAFFRMHEATGEVGVYRRVGHVRAARLDRPLLARSDEGKQVGHPGQWVLEDARGNRWCVPNEQFRRTYRLKTKE